MNYDKQIFGELVHSKINKLKSSLLSKKFKKVTVSYRTKIRQQWSQFASTFSQSKKITPTSLKISQNSSSYSLKASLNTKDTLIQNSTIKPIFTKKRIQIKKQITTNHFICQSCQNNSPDKYCMSCKGNVKIRGGDNMIKFFQYLMQYKCGLKQSYIPKTQSPIKKGLAKIHQSLSRESELSRNSNVQKFSLKRGLSNMELQGPQIHHDYQCDLCLQSPIQGTRYHCSHPDCKDDYDICQGCYMRNGHRHEDDIKAIKKKSKQVYKSVMSNLLGSCDISKKKNIGNIFKSTRR